MIIVRSKNNIPIRLTDERWRHIVLRHPEMDYQHERVLETLANPDFIQQGDFNELIAIRFYSETEMLGKYVVTVYREISASDGFVITAYLTNQPSERREVVWKR